MSRLFPEQRENSIEYWNRLYEVSKGDGFVLPLRLEVNAILTDIAVATKAEELWTLKGRVMQVLSLLQLPDDAFEQLKKYDVNLSQFIRQAIKEKLQRDWKQIKEDKHKIKLPF